MNPLSFLFNVFGRTRRRDFWLFMVCLFALYSFLMGAVSGHGHVAYDQLPVLIVQNLVATDYGFLLLGAVQVVTVIVCIRRCHDRGMSGYWLFAVLVPVLGWLWLFVELGLKDGEADANAWGASPKAGYRTL